MESFKWSTKHWFSSNELFFPSKAFHFNDPQTSPKERDWTHTKLWMNTNTNVVVINHSMDLSDLSTHMSNMQLTSIIGNFLPIKNWWWCREYNQWNSNLSNCTCILEHKVYFIKMQGLSKTGEKKKKKRKTWDGVAAGQAVGEDWLIDAPSHSWPELRNNRPINLEGGWSDLVSPPEFFTVKALCHTSASLSISLACCDSTQYYQGLQDLTFVQGSAAHSCYWSHTALKPLTVNCRYLHGVVHTIN